MARKRVLIVEDDTIVRTTIRELLNGVGYEPVEAGDGTEGLAKAEDISPDVILLDVHMPGLDGYEVCQGLKENPKTKNIPVIFLTAVQDDALKLLAYQTGAVASFMKPFRLEALVAAIEAAIANVERQAKPKREGEESGH